MALEPGIIRRLDEVVVNRIAAGEVIQVGNFVSGAIHDKKNI